ncbi:MAG: nitroreductase/quinone reductase family protein [Pseudomonadota bacterium]
MDMQAFNEQIIAEFRANEGRVAMFADYPMVILHTLGSRTGTLRLVPLVLTINDGGMLLFASFAGAKKNPAWVANLRAHPEIDVEMGTETFAARLVELDAEDAAATVAAQAEISEQFAEYVEKAAPRAIPVFRIERK